MPHLYRSISVSSPGKLLISGEYAVLYGASALAHAINRRAKCDLTVLNGGGWQLDSTPPFWKESLSLQNLLSSTEFPLLSSCIQWFSLRKLLPQHVAIHMDTEDFFDCQVKLGLGSSAAVLTSLCATLTKCMGQPLNAQDVLHVYRISGGTGSGIDLLTSYLGGCVQLEGKIITNQEFPKGIYLDTYSVGFSSDTTTMVDRFRHKFDDSSGTLRDDFLYAADQVTRCLSEDCEFMNAFYDFTEVYHDLDSDLQLSIWTEPHETLYQIAAKLGVVYKPSGAGGGDIGIAVAPDSELLAKLRAKVEHLPVTRLDLQKEIDGVRIEKTE